MQKKEHKLTYQVVKSNELITKARYNLTVMEQKLIAYIISMIQPDDTEIKLYEISVVEFCFLCKIDRECFYTRMKEMVDDIYKRRSFWLKTGDGKEEYFTWFSKVIYEKGKGKIYIKLDSSLSKYVINLKKNYTQYDLSYILQLHGKYSIRVYELLKSMFKSKGCRHVEGTLSLDYIKSLLDIKEYGIYSNFRIRVLEPAFKEINNHTDLSVSYRPEKNGKKIESIFVSADIKTAAELFDIILSLPSQPSRP